MENTIMNHSLPCFSSCFLWRIFSIPPTILFMLDTVSLSFTRVCDNPLYMCGGTRFIAVLTPVFVSFRCLRCTMALSPPPANMFKLIENHIITNTVKDALSSFKTRVFQRCEVAFRFRLSRSFAVKSSLASSRAPKEAVSGLMTWTSIHFSPMFLRASTAPARANLEAPVSV